jgi:DNA-binding transcriptional LysR family regulator
MELRHLRYFIAIAEELSFSRAARRLNLSQPPLSQQILDLERELGVRLFERGPRKVRLTHAGEAFLAEARATLSQADHAALTAQRADRGEVGLLQIGYLTSATNACFAKIIHEFRQLHPEVTLDLRDMNEVDMLRAMRAGSLHAALLRAVPEDDELAVTPLWTDTLNVALPAKHRLARQKQVSLRDLAGEPFIQLNPSFYPIASHCFMLVCREAGFIPRISQQASDYLSLLWLVASGLGIAVATDSLRDLQRDGMVWKPLCDATKAARMLLVTRKDEASPTLVAFRKLAAKYEQRRGRRG